jgi:type IV pilus assembly protein PilA
MKNRNAGFTLIEILIIVAIIAIVAALGIPIYMRSTYTQELIRGQQTLIQQLDAARIGSKRTSQTYWVEWQNGILGKNGGTVNLTRVFNGTTYNPATDTLTSSPLSPNVSISASNSGGFFTKMTFSPPYGRTDADSETFTLTHANLPGSYTVRVIGVLGKVVRVEKQ